MSDQININNLELDDNSFEVLPDGDYHFTVTSHEVGYATSDKMPPNTQRITCNLEIPFMKEGAVKFVTVKNNLNVYPKGFFAIRAFGECIGLYPEKGKASANLDDMDGRTGICSINTREYNGNEYNNVAKFYAPSKAPAVTSNDEAWTMRGMEAVEDDLPF